MATAKKATRTRASAAPKANAKAPTPPKAPKREKKTPPAPSPVHDRQKKSSSVAEGTPSSEPAALHALHALRERCANLADRVAMLEEAARGSQAVFGSSQHQWRRGAPLTEQALRGLEARLAGPLPEEARIWLVTVSSSGAGPGYGLLTPKMRSGSSATKPFLASKKPGAGPFDGCLALADEGCGMTAVLVLQGKHRGQVWTIAQNGARQRRSQDFLSWIESWWTRAAVEWCSTRLYAALLAGHAPSVAHALEPTLESAVASAGEQATEEAWLTLSLLHASAGRFAEALRSASRAAQAFGSALTNRANPNDVANEALERAARGHLYRARVLRLEGKRPEARAEAAEGLRAPHIWESTRSELTAELAVD